MVVLVRKMRTLRDLLGFKIVVVTDRTDLEGQLRETARLSGETLRPNALNQRSRESPTARTQRILREPTADICFAMLQKYQEGARDRNGERVSMTIQRKEKQPGKDQPVIEKAVTLLDQLFIDMFVDYTPQDLAAIKARYGTEGDGLEAPLLIEQKARDMIRHFAGVALPEGFKAQVVAARRR